MQENKRRFFYQTQYSYTITTLWSIKSVSLNLALANLDHFKKISFANAVTHVIFVTTFITDRVVFFIFPESAHISGGVGKFTINASSIYS